MLYSTAAVLTRNRISASPYFNNTHIHTYKHSIQNKNSHAPICHTNWVEATVKQLLRLLQQRARQHWGSDGT